MDFLDSRMSLNCILLLDDISRRKLKVNPSDLVIYGVEIVSSIRDISSRILESSTTVIILDDYVKSSNSLGDLKLYKEVFPLTYIYLSPDDLWLSIMKEFCTCYKMDITLLDYDRIYSVLTNDRDALDKFIIKDKSFLSGDMVVDSLLKNTLDVDVINLANEYKSLRLILDERDNREKQFKNRMFELESQILTLESQNHNLYEGYKSFLLESKKLNESLYQFESILSSDIYEKIPVTDYKERPNILYLKNYEDLVHFESFLLTLFDTFKLQAKLPCKVLRLYDSTSIKSIKTLPNYYKVLTNEFYSSDVINNDFIVKVGSYKKIFDLLLTNKYGLGLLIVVDYKAHEDTVLLGNFVRFDMCRNIKHFEHYGLNHSNTISNNSDSVLSWNTYEEYSSFETEEDRFLFLSSRPIITKIFSLSKSYFEVM